MKAALYAVGAAAFLAMMSWVGNMEAQDRKAELENYCEMVAIWDESNGEYGWPPYDGREGCQ
jgi:hypothetical protein